MCSCSGAYRLYVINNQRSANENKNVTPREESIKNAETVKYKRTSGTTETFL